METTELEAMVYQALVKDKALMRGLPSKGTPVYHMQKPGTHSKHYPYLVYSVLSDVPALTGEDRELFHRVTMRFHIVTKDGGYEEINRNLNRVLLSLGFIRVQTTPYIEDGEKILITDYRIGVNTL